MKKEDTTSKEEKPLASEPDVSSEDGKEADSEVSFKDVVNEELGKDFKDDDSAKKAIKDTFGYVGKIGKYKDVIKDLEDKYGGEKKVLDIMSEIKEKNVEEKDSSSKTTTENQEEKEPSINPDDFVSKSEFQEALWYKDNPEYGDYKRIIGAVQKSEGYKSPSEALEKSEDLKGIVEKAQAHEKEKESKSVLQSNERIGQATDKMKEAAKALQEGDKDTADKNAVDAVIGTFKK